MAARSRPRLSWLPVSVNVRVMHYSKLIFWWWIKNVTFVFKLLNHTQQFNIHCVIIIIMTLGSINFSGISFLIELGRRLTDVSGDARETMYFFPTSFSGGPALQFSNLQRNLHSSYRTGLAPVQQTWFKLLFLTPAIFTTGGITLTKKKQ